MAAALLGLPLDPAQRLAASLEEVLSLCFPQQKSFKPPYPATELTQLLQEHPTLRPGRSLAQGPAATWISAFRGALLCSVGGYFPMGSKKVLPTLLQ